MPRLADDWRHFEPAQALLQHAHQATASITRRTPAVRRHCLRSSAISFMRSVICSGDALGPSSARTSLTRAARSRVGLAPAANARALHSRAREMAQRTNGHGGRRRRGDRCLDRHLGGSWPRIRPASNSACSRRRTESQPRSNAFTSRPIGGMSLHLPPGGQPVRAAEHRCAICPSSSFDQYGSACVGRIRKFVIANRLSWARFRL